MEQAPEAERHARARAQKGRDFDPDLRHGRLPSDLLGALTIDTYRYQAGRRASAARLNEEREEIARLGNLRAGAGLVARSGSGGMQVADVRRRTFWIKLTSVASGTKYAWKEVRDATGGTWTDEGTTGSVASDPAYELNGRTTLTVDGAVYEAWRGETTEEVIFRC